MFHVSQLRRYIRDESHVLDYSELELQSDLSYTKQPMAIMDRRVKTLKNWTIPLVLVSWNRDSPGEATWEHEDVIRDGYPHLFEPWLIIFHMNSISCLINPLFFIFISFLIEISRTKFLLGG